MSISSVPGSNSVFILSLPIDKVWERVCGVAAPVKSRGRMDVQIHRTRMRRIERIDADLLGIYPFVGSALAYGAPRALILLADSYSAGGAAEISRWGGVAQPPKAPRVRVAP